MNSGAKLFLFILIGCAAILIIVLVLIGVFSKGKKIKGGIKFLVVILSLITCAAFVTFPLAYHNYIDVNLRYGYFKSVNEQDEIKITRHSCEYISYSGSSLLDGTWTIENDKLTMKFSNAEKVYEVKDLGTKLYQNGELAFRYMKDKKIS